MTKSGFEPLTHGVWIRCSNQLSYFANIISYMSTFKRRHTTVTFSAFQKGIQHRWLRGLRRYLIGFAPHAFAPQCQIWARKVLSLSVFLLISKNLTSPLEIPLSSLSLQCNRSFRFTYYINKDLTKSYETQPTRHLRPIIPNNTCSSCLTAAAGTEFAGASFLIHVKFSRKTVYCFSFQWKGFTINITFVTHAIELDQACAQCPRFLTAASMKSSGRLSVPMWLIVR